MKTYRIGTPVLGFLDGSGVWQEPDALDRHGYGDAGRTMVEKCKAAHRRKDGSIAVKLTDDEAWVVAVHVDTMISGALDNVGDRWSAPWALAEINSGRAFLRKYEGSLES